MIVDRGELASEYLGTARSNREGTSEGPDTLPRRTPRRTVEHAVELLRERIYGAVSCLAALALLAREGADAEERLVGLAVVATGLFAASLFAEGVALLAVNGSFLRGPHGLAAVRASFQIILSAMLPAVPLVLAVAGWLDADGATWFAVALLVAELALFALLAVRRMQLRALQQIVAIATLVAIGAAVLSIKMIAH